MAGIMDPEPGMEIYGPCCGSAGRGQPRVIFFFNGTIFFRYNGAHPMGRDAIIPHMHHIATRIVE